MARFTLQPCKLREERLVPTKEPCITVGWKELCELLAPTREPAALKVLQLLQINSFVGLVQKPSGTGTSNFIMTNADRTGSLSRVIAKDPTFAGRFQTAFRVESTEWDAKVVELAGEGPRPRGVT